MLQTSSAQLGDNKDVTIDDILWDEDAQRESEAEISALMNDVTYDRGDDAQMELYPAEFVELAIKLSIAGGIRDFSFADRPYLASIYNSSARRILLKCGRQVEKCEWFRTLTLMEDGSVKELQDVAVGDRVVGLGADTASTSIGTVSWKSELLEKRCVRIKTRQGHESIMSLTHPMRTWGGWTEAGDLVVGSRIAAVRQAGMFTGDVVVDDDEVILAAAMIAEGDCQHTPTISQNFGPYVDLVDKACRAKGVHFRLDDLPSGKGVRFNFVKNSDGSRNKMRTLLDEWGMYGTTSFSKAVPKWVFGLDQRQTALFINTLWAGDGHASIQGSSYHLEYDSVSKGLVRGVQRLLWKFGIPTSIRDWQPSLYKGTDKLAYKLRIETRDGAIRFVESVGALGKTENLPIINVGNNSNRDTYPLEISEDIKCVHRARPGFQRRGRFVPKPSLRSAGLREKPKYPLSKSKLREYVEFFRSDHRFDQSLTEALAAHLETDLFWDEVVSIEDVGDLPCYDITVDGTDSFVGDGLVTHNSTLLGNLCLAYSALNPSFKTLYVSATAQQAQVFSVDRIKEPIETSPVLLALTNKALSQNVFFKQFINRSQIRLRYAFLSADRVRGIPADKILIDEIQDILTENIPVIEECASHSEWKLMRYSGTPKSLDNTIEVYWQRFSTQNEWMVPCEGCNNWNELGERNIGKTGVICARCGRPINVRHPKAMWAAKNPVSQYNEDEVAFEGFRIPQIMVPWVTDSEEGWADILLKQKQYSRAKFFNEALGLSYDSGTRPLKSNQIESCCLDNIRMAELEENVARAGGQTFMGIDWGTGESVSFTVVTIGGYIDGRFTIFFVHRFTGQELEPALQLDIIGQLVRRANVQLIGSDYGGGFDRNDTLMRIFGRDKLWKYQYAGRPNQKLVWQSKLGRFIVHRTEVMSDIFNAIKRRQLRFPKWTEFRSPYSEDMLNIFSEHNDALNMTQYKLSPGKSDDTFHSILYCFLVSMLVRPRLDVLIPNKQNDVVLPS